MKLAIVFNCARAGSKWGSNSSSERQQEIGILLICSGLFIGTKATFLLKYSPLEILGRSVLVGQNKSARGEGL